MKSGLLDLPAKSARVLHVAPSEKGVARNLGEFKEYVAGDFAPERYKNPSVIQLDLCDLGRHGKFDLIYLSHVLEHIIEDRKAMREMLRALNVGGQVWILVPLGSGPTVDGEPDLGPAERARLFGQADHVRYYGADIADRLREEGFSVDVILPKTLDPELFRANGLSEMDYIFCCRKANHEGSNNDFRHSRVET